MKTTTISFGSKSNAEYLARKLSSTLKDDFNVSLKPIKLLHALAKAQGYKNWNHWAGAGLSENTEQALTERPPIAYDLDLPVPFLKRAPVDANPDAATSYIVEILDINLFDSVRVMSNELSAELCERRRKTYSENPSITAGSMTVYTVVITGKRYTNGRGGYWYYDPEVKYFHLPKDSDSGSFVTEKYLNELRSVQSNTVVEMMPPEYDGLGHAVICDKCGLNYVPNLAEDRVLHHQFCTLFSSASEYFGRPLFTYEMFEKAKSVQLNDPNPTIADQAALYKNKLWGYFSRSVQAWMRQRDFKEHPPFFVYSQAMIASDLDDGHVSHDVAQYVAKDMGIEHLEQSPAMPSGSSYWAIDDNI
ncbi:hypothetical protein V6957_003804 [Vibrio parahaemolyticus]|uniref:hypothetical protein n=1 Tax=Vibrio parahaemolyticus TaxID=670 RepID=UPI000B77C179|nr:hypothetical protein [Vibrio parahaemolyticus]OXD00628.1 hypothetical protein CA161_19720 [Vibrio parahaemolyticus]